MNARVTIECAKKCSAIIRIFLQCCCFPLPSYLHHSGHLLMPTGCDRCMDAKKMDGRECQPWRSYEHERCLVTHEYTRGSYCVQLIVWHSLLWDLPVLHVVLVWPLGGLWMDRMVCPSETVTQTHLPRPSS